MRQTGASFYMGEGKAKWGLPQGSESTRAAAMMPRRPTSLLRSSVFHMLPLVVLWASLAISDVLQPDAAPSTEFQFIRLAYNNHPDFGGWRRSWLTDAPEAETHFLDGLKRLTRVDTRSDSVGLSLLDSHLFDYPFLYAVEVGHWSLSDAEVVRLREYLLKGGFLVVDDFHGTLEWQVFAESMRRVFPDRPMEEVADTDAVFHVLYEVDQRVQIPSIRGAITGQSWEKDGYTPHWRGIYDDAGRLMVMINFNMDLGDAWEHADNPRYPQPLTLLAYHFGINYVLYAMTH